ncbi:MAG: immune inhibitor A [Planctomycetes bacterium]|nr:immune inhibitor A [Planctomycetota bacterium]
MAFRAQSTSIALVAALLAFTGCNSGSKSKSGSTAAAVTTQQNTTPAGQSGTIKVAALNAARAFHTATLTGQAVIVIGGESGGSVLASAEQYQGGAWSPVGSLSTARTQHTATKLANGQILVAGGQADVQGSQILASTELFDPATGAFTPGPSMGVERSGHVAIAFTNLGKEYVLIAGGSSTTGSLNSAEVYDVQAGIFVPVAAPMIQDRVGAEAVRLPTGEIVIQGGITNLVPGQQFSTTPAGVESFDPASLTFAAMPTLGVDRFGSALSMNERGEAIVIGGNSQARWESSIETLDRMVGTWVTSAAQLSAPREALTLTASSKGLVAAGGVEQGVSGAVELIKSGQVSALTALLSARYEHTATALPNGNLLFVGGLGSAGAALGDSEEYAVAASGTGTVGSPTPPTTPIGPTPPTQPAPPAQQPARMLAILPDKGKPGDLITIAGSGFAKDKNDNIVLFQGGVQGKVMFNLRVQRIPVLGSVETLIVEVPQGAQTGDVQVISTGVPALNTKTFTVDLATAKTPKILYTLPRRAREGGLVTIFGRNFARPASDNIVRFSGVQANLIGGITTQSVPFLGSVAVMLVRVPTGAVTGDLTIEAYGKVSPGYRFEVTGTTASSQPSQPAQPSQPSQPSTPGMQTFFAEDFDGQTLRFTQQGGQWQVGAPVFGPSAAVSGQSVVGTAMSQGTYSANANAYLISREIDLTQATTATLSMKQWYETDGIDAGRVLITPDGGTTYYLLRPAGGYSQTPQFNPGEGFTGASNGWVDASYDLGQFVGSRVTIVLQFGSDANDQRAGWYIDDFVVRGN